jgi:ubiquinone/menaquinone biosynthesis C-methylase UbiE
VPDVTVGDHFERVAAVYESLRTTDEAPVRRIGELLPDRPVTGLDIGCGTGRYSRLLRGLLPDGSLLVASDVSAAMLAELKPGGHGHALGVVPLLSAAEELPLRTASLRPRVSASTTSFPSHPAHLPVAGQRTCGSAR